MRRGRRRSPGLAVVLLAGGGIAVVSVALALLAVPAWISPGPVSGDAASAPPGVTDRSARSPRDRAAARDGAPTPAPPPLTFYRDLKAPLARPPESREPATGGAEPRRPEARRGEGRAMPPRPTKPEPAAPSVVGEPRSFTVQVAAFLVPASAEALRDRLSAAGFDAYVVKGESAEGVRYRVRVGAFMTREEARELADRLSTERGQPTYVTTR